MKLPVVRLAIAPNQIGGFFLGPSLVTASPTGALVSAVKKRLPDGRVESLRRRMIECMTVRNLSPATQRSTSTPFQEDGSFAAPPRRL
jgi:hypothetical protein